MRHKPEGWGWPLQASKAHYFRDGVSLCESWLLVDRPLEPGHAADTDCKRCAKQLARKPAPVVEPDEDVVDGTVH